LLELIEPFAYGELRLTPESFGKLTMKEFNALVDGYIRRRDAFEDLLIVQCALPVYRSMLGDKAPTYEDLIAYRKRRHKQDNDKYVSDLEYWEKKLDELERGENIHA
jgi:hypothetical protein